MALLNGDDGTSLLRQICHSRQNLRPQKDISKQMGLIRAASLLAIDNRF